MAVCRSQIWGIMKIQALTNIRTEREFLGAGDVGECVDELGRRLVAAGMAKVVDDVVQDVFDEKPEEVTEPAAEIFEQKPRKRGRPRK